MKACSRYFAISLMLWSSWALSATWIEVEESGRTVEEAKQRCFHSAITRVVGELVVSDTEVSGDQVTREFIGGYSAGYVNDYEIQQTFYEGDRVILHMQVNVASSKIAERMRTNSNHRTTLSGENLSTKVDTILEQRFKGDRILSNVLSSYPHNAYIINSGQTEAVIGTRRQIYLDLPYEIRWSRYWIEALNESLNQVTLEAKSCSSIPYKKLEQLSFTANAIKFLQESACGREADVSITYKKSSDWLLQKSNYYFPDLSTLDAVNAELRTPIGQQHIGLVAELKDSNGNIVDTICTKIPTEPLLEYTTLKSETINWAQYDKHLRPRINGQIGVSGILRIQTKNVNLVNVHRVDMHLEKTCS